MTGGNVHFLPIGESRPFIRIEHMERLRSRLSVGQAERNDDAIIFELVDYLDFAMSRAPDDEDLFVAGYTLATVIPSNLVKRVVGTAISRGHDRQNSFLVGLVNRRFPSTGGGGFKDIGQILQMLQSDLSLSYSAQIRSALSERFEVRSSMVPTSDDARVAKAVARQLLRRNDIARVEGARTAQWIAKELLVWWPQDSHAWVLWARGLMKEAAYEDAEYLLWEVLRRHPDNYWVWYYLAMSINLSNKDANLSISVCREAIEIFGGVIALKRSLAYGLEKRGDIEDIIDALYIFSAEFISNNYSEDKSSFIRRQNSLVGFINRNIDLISKNVDLVDWHGAMGEKLRAIVALLARVPFSRGLAVSILKRSVSTMEVGRERSILRAMWARYSSLMPGEDSRAEAVAALECALVDDPQDVHAAIELTHLLEDVSNQRAQEVAAHTYAVKKSAPLLARMAQLIVYKNKSDWKKAREMVEAERGHFDKSNQDVRSALALAEVEISFASGNFELVRIRQLLEEAKKGAEIRRFAHLFIQRFGEMFGRGVMGGPSDVSEDSFPNSLEKMSSKNDSEFLSWFVSEPAVSPDVPLPDGILRWGQLRKARFLIEQNFVSGKREVESIIEAYSHPSAYADVLAARFANAQFSDMELSRSLPLALEVAVRDHDSAALDLLQTKMLGFEAVGLLAKAIIGDTAAIAALGALSGSSDLTNPAEAYIRSQVAKLDYANDDTKEIEKSHLSIFRDVNDMMLKRAEIYY